MGAMRSFVIVVTLLLGLSATTYTEAQSVRPAVFVTNNVGNSLTSFTINPDGTLNRVGVFATGAGPQTISLTPHGRFLAVGHGTASTTTEELRIFAVNPDATLASRVGIQVPDSPLDVQWLSNDILAVTQTSSSGANHVRTFRYDDVQNTLTLVDTKSTGSFNSRLATARGGSLLYANNSLGSSSIYAFEVAPNGQLTLIENEPTSPFFAVAITATNDGRFLYGGGGISGDGNRILGFSVANSGALSPLTPPTFTSPGESPKVIAFTPDDRIMVAGHGTDATFWSFLRDTQTGALTPTPYFFDVGLQGTLADLQILGDLMFVTDNSTALDGIAGIYSFRIHADGSFTQLGPIRDTLGARPEFIAPWKGLRLPCDFDQQWDCDLDDLNALLAQGPIAPGVPVIPGQNDQFDLNGDAVLNLADRDLWLSEAAAVNGLSAPYSLGDANLDSQVNLTDWMNWHAHIFTSTTRWDAGDFTGDGRVDGVDFGIWNVNKSPATQAVAVPEPGAILEGIVCLGLLFLNSVVARSSSQR